LKSLLTSHLKLLLFVLKAPMTKEKPKAARTRGKSAMKKGKGKVPSRRVDLDAESEDDV
jgi:hypothetical protein